MANQLPLVIDVCALVLLVVCAIWDVRYRRIPNWATLPGIALGLGMNGLLNGWAGVKMSGIGFLVGFGALLIMFALGWMGGGDIKLMAAVGALKGSPFVLWALFFSLIVGAVIGIAALIWNRKTLRTFKNIFQFLGSRLLPFLPIPKNDLRPEETQKIPFGLAIVLGTIWAMAMKSGWSPLA
jgi:prepilin peptidase CpaA